MEKTRFLSDSRTLSVAGGCLSVEPDHAAAPADIGAIHLVKEKAMPENAGDRGKPHGQGARIGHFSEKSVDDDIALIGPLGANGRLRAQIGQPSRDEGRGRRAAPRPAALPCRCARPASSASAMTIIRREAAATIFSRSMAPPAPLIANSRSSISSAPSMVRSTESTPAKSTSVMPPSAPSIGAQRGGDRADIEPAAHQLAQPPDREGSGRAGTEADQHARADLLHRGEGGGAFVVIGHGRPSCRDDAPS